MDVKRIFKAKVKSFFLFAIVFVLVKSLLIITPFWFSNTYSRETYGLLEYILGLAAFIAIGINLGMNGAYPYFILKKKDTEYKGVINLHYLFASLLTIVLSILAYLLDYETVSKALIVATVLSIQMYYSVVSKTEERPKRAVIIDSGIYIIIGVYLTFSFFTPVDSEILYLLLGLYLLFLIGFLVKTRTNSPLDFSRYKKSISYGTTLVLSSFCILSFTAGGKILVEHFLDIDSVAIYSFYFRIASIVMIFHQVATIFLFKKYYESDHRILDKLFPLVLILLFLINLFFYNISHLILTDYLDLFRQTFDTYYKLYFIFLFHVALWVILSLNETLVYRENLASEFNVRVFFIIVIYLLSLYMIDNSVGLSLISLASVNVVAISFVITLQLFLLKTKSDTFLPKTAITVILFTFSFIIYQLL